MADEGTAVLDVTETEQVENEAPVEELETDELLDESPETGESEEAETVEPGLSEDEVAERIKTAIAEREAEWKAEQEAQAYKYRITEAEKQLSQEAARGIGNMIAWAAKQVEEGKSAAEVLALVNQRAVNSLAGPLAAAVSTSEYEARIHLMDDYQKKTAPDWKPSVDLVRQMERARNTGDPRIVFESQLEYIRQMVVETEGPKLTEKALKEREEKAKKAGTVAQKKAETSERAARPGPTTGVGGNAAPRRTVESTISIEDKKKVFEEQYGIPFPG